MAAPSFTLCFRVPLYDLDYRDEAPCAALFRYFEETAIQASAHAGFGLDWYRERHQFWVLRTIRLERTGTLHYGDELEVSTWVSAMTRVRADRNYLARTTRDGKVVARALANWVYLDSKSLFPARIAPEIVAIFSNGPAPIIPNNDWRRFAVSMEGSTRARTTRHAQYFEADSARHTNNAVYVNWFEEAVRDALIERRYPLPVDGEPQLQFVRHSIDYLTSARPGDQLDVATRLIGRGRSVGQWEQTICRKVSGELVARDQSITLWCDQTHRVSAWPLAA
jgi:acyl-CoA thioesterase FadM